MGRYGITIYLALCFFVSGFHALADSDECGLLGCRPATNEITKEGVAGESGVTAIKAKYSAIRSAALRACNKSRSIAKNSKFNGLKCPDSENCMLFGVTEVFPKDCSKSPSLEEMDSWESVTVTEGTEREFFRECERMGLRYHQCRDRWYRWGHRFFATATADFTTTVKRPCRNKDSNSCFVPEPVNIEEILEPYSERDAE